MFSFKNLAATALGVMVLGTAVQEAQAGQFYVCDMNTKAPNGWVSPTVGIVFEDNGKVTVIDAVTQHFHGGPKQAQASKNGNKVRVSWTIANPVDIKGERLATMRYVATLNTQTRGVNVVAKPVGPPQSWRAKGQCKLRAK